MRSRCVHHWVFWLLPLFAVRALIPAGFMLAPAQGSWQLVLCPAQGALIAPQSAPAAAGYHGYGADAAGVAAASGLAEGSAHDHALPGHVEHPSGSGLHNNSICPFALAGMAVLTAAAAASPLYLERVIASVPAETNRQPFSGPGGIERIRGPPVV